MLANRIVADSGREEIAWNQARTLMNQLIKSMLTVCTRFTPNNRSSLVSDDITISIYAFTVALHIALLKICGKAVHILVIWQNGFRFCSKEIDIPNPNHRQQNRQIAFKRRILKVFIHRMKAFQHLFEIIKTNIQSNRQPDSGSQRITPADPIPKTKHISRINTEFDHVFFISRKRDKMQFDMLFILRFL